MARRKAQSDIITRSLFLRKVMFVEIDVHTVGDSLPIVLLGGKTQCSHLQQHLLTQIDEPSRMTLQIFYLFTLVFKVVLKTVLSILNHLFFFEQRSFFSERRTFWLLFVGEYAVVGQVCACLKRNLVDSGLFEEIEYFIFKEQLSVFFCYFYLAILAAQIVVE